MKRTEKRIILSLVFVFFASAVISHAGSQKRYVKPPEEEETEQDSEKQEIAVKKPEEKPGDAAGEKNPGEVKVAEPAVKEKPAAQTEPKTEAQKEPVVKKVQEVPVRPSLEVSSPVSVVLMVANGMGPSLYGIAKYYSQFVEDKPLNMEKVMNDGATGYMVNRSADFIVPDNASAASALATGCRVKNGVISITPEGGNPETILEKMQEMGMSVGLVTNCEVNDALTAAFSAHAENENMKEAIALQQLEKNMDVVMGGGFKWFDVLKRSDGKDLIQRAQKMNYNIVTSRNELSKIRVKDTEKLIGLFAERMLDFSVNDNKKQPTLTHMVRVALGVLKNNKRGFFLLVEGGRIAHAAHGKLTKEALGEILAFDEAVGEVLMELESSPEILLIVTSNMEVGCPILSKSDWKDEYMREKDLKGINNKNNELIKWPTKCNTATPVFVFAIGPGSEKVAGLHDNTHMIEIMETERPGLGMEVIPETEMGMETMGEAEKGKAIPKRKEPVREEKKPKKRRRRR